MVKEMSLGPMSLLIFIFYTSLPTVAIDGGCTKGWSNSGSSQDEGVYGVLESLVLRKKLPGKVCAYVWPEIKLSL